MTRLPSRKTLLLLFLAAYGITLLASAPASLLGSFLGKQVHGTIEFASPHGTIWHGSATPVLHLALGRPVPLEQVEWNIRFAPLLQGKIGLVLNQAGWSATRTTELSIGIHGLEIKRLSAAVPAQILGTIHPLLQAIHPQGTLEIDGNNLALSPQTITGTATAKWLGAGSAISTVNPFGSYQIDIRAAGSQVELQLSTLSGPLMLDGKGNWSVNAGLALDAHARAAPGSQDALAELMHHLGPEISPGVRLIKIGGVI